VTLKLGFAGAGNMAAAMARGWALLEEPPAMAFCDLDSMRAEALAAEVGGEVVPDLPGLRDNCDVLVLAVKPAALEEVAAELDARAPALLSVMAATGTDRLAAAFPGVPTLRVMPNQPAEVGAGVLCYVIPEGMDAELAGSLVALLDALGTAIPVAEERMEAAMAVMSCAPAYVALFARALAGAGAANGLDPADSMELVAGTLDGTAELLRKRDAAEIMRAVAPPGGATEAGLEALADGGFEEAIAAAVEASLERFR
jgi:pyrroline-5-carboxylate reductase